MNGETVFTYSYPLKGRQHEMIRILRSEFKRARSLRLLVFLFIPVCLPMDTIVDWQWLFESKRLSVFYFYFHAVQFGGLFGRHFVSMFCAMPFCLSFVDEYKAGMSSYLYQKSRAPRAYLFAKHIVSVVTGGCVMALGTALFFAILSAFVPLVHENDILESLAYYPLLVLDEGQSYFICAVYFAFLSGALYAAVACVVSAFIPNRYITAASPMVFSFFLAQCSISENSMFLFYLSRLISMRMRIGSIALSMMCTTFIVLGIVIALGIVFVWRAKRRIVYDS